MVVIDAQPLRNDNQAGLSFKVSLNMPTFEESLRITIER